MSNVIYGVLMLVAFATALLGLFALLPVASPLPPEIGDAVYLLVGYLRVMDFILPIGTLFTIVVIWVNFELILFLVGIIKWVVPILRSMMGRS